MAVTLLNANIDPDAFQRGSVTRAPGRKIDRDLGTVRKMLQLSAT